MRILNLFLLITLFTSIIGCDKESTAGTNNAPTELTLNAVVSNDSSGNVTFTATANNAVSYEFDFGNGNYEMSTTGVVTYKYPVSGTYTAKVTAKSATGQTANRATQVTVTMGLVLLWSDEFDAAGAPDPAKWSYETGTGDNGWGNNEVQYYTNRAQNVAVSNGTLKITARKENFNGSAYTSARIVTKDKFDFTYGKVEISAKFPTGVGTWPALWMLGANINTVSWPACGEIDIVEHLGRDVNKVFSTLHYPGRSGGNANGSSKVISNATTEFHKYSLDWSATSIKSYVDDQLYHTVPNSNSIPFNHDFFFIINMALGGNFGGPVDPNFSSATMEVDYIRVYK